MKIGNLEVTVIILYKWKIIENVKFLSLEKFREINIASLNFVCRINIWKNLFLIVGNVFDYLIKKHN